MTKSWAYDMTKDFLPGWQKHVKKESGITEWLPTNLADSKSTKKIISFFPLLSTLESLNEITHPGKRAIKIVKSLKIKILTILDPSNPILSPHVSSQIFSSSPCRSAVIFCHPRHLFSAIWSLQFSKGTLKPCALFLFLSINGVIHGYNSYSLLR